MLLLHWGVFWLRVRGTWQSTVAKLNECFGAKMPDPNLFRIMGSNRIDFTNVQWRSTYSSKWCLFSCWSEGSSFLVGSFKESFVKMAAWQICHFQPWAFWPESDSSNFPFELFYSFCWSLSLSKTFWQKLRMQSDRWYEMKVTDWCVCTSTCRGCMYTQEERRCEILLLERILLANAQRGCSQEVRQ